MLGIREVKLSFSRYVNRVAYGRERLIIEHCNGQPYAPDAPVAVNRGPRCVSDLLVEDREPGWWSDAFPEAQP